MSKLLWQGTTFSDAHTWREITKNLCKGAHEEVCQGCNQCCENHEYTRILAQFNNILEETKLTLMEDCWLSGLERVWVGSQIRGLVIVPDPLLEASLKSRSLNPKNTPKSNLTNWKHTWLVSSPLTRPPLTSPRCRFWSPCSCLAVLHHCSRSRVPLAIAVIVTLVACNYLVMSWKESSSFIF